MRGEWWARVFCKFFKYFRDVSPWGEAGEWIATVVAVWEPWVRKKSLVKNLKLLIKKLIKKFRLNLKKLRINFKNYFKYNFISNLISKKLKKKNAKKIRKTKINFLTLIFMYSLNFREWNAKLWGWAHNLLWLIITTN